MEYKNSPASKKPREYKKAYKPIEVTDHYVYYYPKEWFKLSVYDHGSWISVANYCRINLGKHPAECYDRGLTYGIKNPNYPQTSQTKYKTLSKNEVSDIKIYNYDDIKYNIYHEEKGAYVQNDANTKYDKNKKYYFLYNRIVPTENFNATSLMNDYNEASILTEREFKLTVLNWLNNGKPKLFRSPVEGNYIVRLMNSSLTPNDQLGRALHTFNSTAYEVEEFNFEKLKSNNFVNYQDLTVHDIRWETIRLDRSGIGDNKKNLLNYEAKSIRFEGMIPGDRVTLRLREGDTSRDLDIVIGMTGSYNLDLTDNVTITGVCVGVSMDNINVDEKYTQHKGIMTYGYESIARTPFDTITDVSTESVPLRQFFGAYDDILSEINDVKTQVQEIYFIHALLRPQVTLYQHEDEEGTYYTSDKSGQNKKLYYYEKNGVLKDDLSTYNNRYYIYKLLNNEDIVGYYDAYSYKIIEIKNSDEKDGDKIWFNGNTDSIQVFDNNDFLLKQTEDIFSIKTGYRVLLEMSYQQTKTLYGVEEQLDETKNKELKTCWDEYTSKYTAFKNALNNSEKSVKEVYSAYAEAQNAYKVYTEKLEEILVKEGGIEGNEVDKECFNG